MQSIFSRIRSSRHLASAFLIAGLVFMGGVDAAVRQQPLVMTGAASTVSATGATANGTLNPEGRQTTYHFEYGPSTRYGSSTPSVSRLNGSSPIAVNASLSGLSAGTVYHFHLVASNAYGTSSGADAMFTTGSASAPVAAFTNSPSAAVTGSAVSFDGTSPICIASPCSYRWTDDADGSLLGTGSTMSFIFQDAGTKYVRLNVTDTLAQSNSVEHNVVVSSNTSGTTSGPSASSGTLTWSPPVCGDATHACVDLYLTNTGANQRPSLNLSSDYRLHLPTTGPLVGGLQITGGRNVQIIGGEIDLTYPCSDASSACHGINISRGSASGEVYIEGVYIKNPDPNYRTDTLDTGDGIDVDDYPGVTDIVLQNVRIEGIKGCDPATPSAHADVFQPYNAGNATMNVDHLTGVSDCQGMQIDPDYAYLTYGLLPKSGTFKNVNLDVFANPSLGNGNRYMWWLTLGTSSCVSFPITLSSVYVQEPDGTLYDNAVWPDPVNTYPAACLGAYSNGVALWPALPNVTGTVSTGLPPGGDFVPIGAAGIGYVSPGYQ